MLFPAARRDAGVTGIDQGTSEIYRMIIGNRD
jgi:hypothetical protein